MAKVRKTRKASVNVANNSALPALLQLAFYASEPEDAPAFNDDSANNNEILVIENTGNANESDIFDAYKVAIAQAFHARISHNETTDNSRDWLVNDAKATLNNSHTLRLFFDARVMPDVMTRVTSGSKMFDMKTYRRALDIAHYVTGARSDLNNQAQAIFESLVRFERAGHAFTYEHARNACNSERVYSPEIERLMSHTKSYGLSTQNRQSGMSINALVMLNAVLHRKSGKHSVYTVNPESAIAQKLIAKLDLRA